MELNLGQKIADQILEESKQIIGLFAGKFKLPHKGHFSVVEKASKICDKVQVIISNNVTEGYTPQQSLNIWNLYKKYLPNNVEISISKANTPITEIYNIIKDKTNNYFILYGKEEKDRFNSINENREKYSNAEIIDCGNFGEISSTKLRKYIKTNDKLKIIETIHPKVNLTHFLNEIKVISGTTYKPYTFKAKYRMESGNYSGDLIYDNKVITKTSVLILRNGTPKMLVTDKNAIENKDHKIEFFEFDETSTQLKLELVNLDLNINELINYNERLKKMALEKDPEGLTPLGQEYLDESKQVGTVYHFTNLFAIEKILESNILKASKISPADSWERDLVPFIKTRRHEKAIKQSEEHLYFISTTRNKLFYIKKPKIKGSYIRITLDGNKLSNKYKFQPFAYFGHELEVGKDYKNSSDESEERIMLDEQEINNISSYILNVEIILDKVKDNISLLNHLNKLIIDFPQVKCVYDEKEITIEEYIKDKKLIISIDEVKITSGTKNYLPELKDMIIIELEDNSYNIDAINLIKNSTIGNIIDNLVEIDFAREENEDIEFYNYFLKNGKFDLPSKNLNESIQVDPKLYIQLLNKCVEECCKELEIDKPKIIIINNDSYTKENKSYGGYLPATNEIKLVVYGRLLKDVMVTICHELKHSEQKFNNRLTNNAGKDFDVFENESNSFAGGFMRGFGRNNPEIYTLKYDKN